MLISAEVREAKLESVPASCSLLRVVFFSRSAALLHVDDIVARGLHKHQLCLTHAVQRERLCSATVHLMGYKSRRGWGVGVSRQERG